MPTATISPCPSLDSPPASAPMPVRRHGWGLFEISGPEPRWDGTTWLAFLSLVAWWAFRMFTTWGTWGDLTIDCGREMYVAGALAEGKMLYRDVWYTYGPASPYVNSYLFRWFGLHLSVLYWAGSLSALGCAVLLFLVGKKFSSRLAGWTAAAIVLIQAFQPWIFSFPLPYTFAAVYGCLTACLFLWFAVNGALSSSAMWVFAAGTCSAVALLLKPEYGAACYAALALLILTRWVRHRSWRSFVRDGAAILPGVVGCLWVIGWMISIRGVEFITQENLMSWPTSYFMTTYGRMWLDRTGLSVTGPLVGDALLRTGLWVGIGVLLYRDLRRRAAGTRGTLLITALSVSAVAWLVGPLLWQMEEIFRTLFFPRGMVLYAGAAAVAAGWYFWRHPASDRAGALALLLAFSCLLALRLLLGMASSGYPIYYNGPAILCFLLLAPVLFSLAARPSRPDFPIQLVICFAALIAVWTQSEQLDRRELVPLVTERGTIGVTAQKAENYRRAIAFMKEKAALGEAVLSIPEDTSLYFLSGVACPIRVLSFTPGTLAPGKMTEEVIQDIERADVRYLLWSNRTFVEYGVTRFGTDYDRAFGDYLRSRYRFVRPLAFGGSVWDWNASVWERKSAEESP